MNGWCVVGQGQSVRDERAGTRGGMEPSLDFFRAFFEINIFVFIIVSRVV